MLNINVTVRDPALNISRDFTIAVDEQLLIRDLAAQLVRRLMWPEKDIQGHPVNYVIRNERARVLLTGDELIRAVGLLNGDILTIGPLIDRANTTASASVADSSSTYEMPPYSMVPLQRP